MSETELLYLDSPHCVSARRVMQHAEAKWYLVDSMIPTRPYWEA
jgi:hypothetical protein